MLGADIRGHFRWIPSEVNPSDHNSRLWERPHSEPWHPPSVLAARWVAVQESLDADPATLAASTAEADGMLQYGGLPREAGADNRAAATGHEVADADERPDAAAVPCRRLDKLRAEASAGAARNCTGTRKMGAGRKLAEPRVAHPSPAPVGPGQWAGPGKGALGTRSGRRRRARLQAQNEGAAYLATSIRELDRLGGVGGDTSIDGGRALWTRRSTTATAARCWRP